MASLSLALAACSGSGGGDGPPPRPVEVGDAQFLESSPFDGEEGVAVTRETILRFSDSLDDQTIRAGVQVRAIRDGVERVVRPNLHLSPDQNVLTLFYPDRLPAGSDIEVRLDGSRLRSLGTGDPVDVDGDGRTGGRQILRFRALDLERVPNTDLCGRVLASEREDDRDVPLRGVTISVDGLEDQVFTRTDALGNFCLRNVPVGDVFLHIDGTTVENAPEGFYYPNVGKAKQALAGQRLSMGTVYLPRVPVDALQPVSADSDTSIGLADVYVDSTDDPVLRSQLAAVRVDVPADSLFADDGTRGGRVGLGLVDPDRLPGELPPGLSLPLVITVQTDGATNFDQPVPVAFPNLPDPETGELLPAGAKTALWSFDHDTGRFEVVGPMTVSADGLMVVTDDGVGLRAPGWHGPGQGTPGVGGPPNDGCDGCCEDANVWEILSRVYKITKALAKCGLAIGSATYGVSGLETYADCFFSVADFVQALGDQINTIVSLEDIGVSEAAALFGDLTAKKSTAIDLLRNCVSASPGSPMNAVRAAIECVRSLNTILQVLCDAAGDCGLTTAQAAACSALATGNDLLNYAISLADGIENEIERRIQEGVCGGIEAALSILERYTMESVRSGVVEPTIDPEDRDQLFMVLQGIVDQGPAAGRIEQAISDIVVLEQQVMQITGEVSGVADGVVESNGVPAPSVYDYVIREVEDDSVAVEGLRGRSNGRGVWRSILAPRELYEIVVYDPARRAYGEALFESSATGRRTRIPSPPLLDVEGAPDVDGDGLIDDAELVYGTDPEIADTDGDGVSDGDEVHAGEDPLDGIGGLPGILASVATAGAAIDVCAEAGLVAVAEGAAGVEIFNSFGGLEPVRIARLDTPGDALRVSCDGTWVAVADGSFGLALIDLSDPAEPVLRHRVAVGDARAVAMSQSVAIVGTASGRVSVVDAESGEVLSTASAGSAVVDLAIRRGFVYALSDRTIQVLERRGAILSPAGNLDLGRDRCRRLFAGVDELVAVHWRGFVTLDPRMDPANPMIVSATDTPQFGWQSARTDGQGRALCVVGTNSSPSTNDDVQLFDVADPSLPGSFLRSYADLGFAGRTPSMAVFENGLAYVVDRQGTLHTLRTEIQDLGDQAPSIDLRSSAAMGIATEGERLWFDALVDDDTQVAYVDFFVDGERIDTDGAYPFEFELVAPSLALGSSITVEARVWDTGGNARSADPIVMSIVPDLQSPEVLRTVPSDGGVVAAGQPLSVLVVFDESMDPASIRPDDLMIVAAGADGLLDTDDDELLPTDSAEWVPGLQAARFGTMAEIPTGALRLSLGGPTDVAGNAAAPIEWQIEAVEGLRMRMFRSFNSTLMTSFFEGVLPEEFTVLRAGGVSEVVRETVVPNVNFTGGSGARMRHAGADGSNNGSVSNPAGDDIAFISPGSRDSFAFTIEGSLTIPVSGDYQFRVNIDDQVVLEIDGQRMISVTSGCRVATPSGPVVRLEAGTYPFRMSAADLCSCCVQARLRYSGPQGGGIVPAQWFGQ